jgi:hypothetical protein
MAKITDLPATIVTDYKNLTKSQTYAVAAKLNNIPTSFL